MRVIKIRNKEIKDYINVSVVIDIECGDTRDNNFKNKIIKA